MAGSGNPKREKYSDLSNEYVGKGATFEINLIGNC